MKPTGRVGRLLALGLTLAVPAAAWFAVAAPLLQWHDDRAEALAQRQALAEHMRALQVALPELRQQAAAVAASGAGEPALLDGDSDPVASAFLQERLQSMFMAAGVQLNSIETLPGEDASAYRRIRLQVTFNTTWPVLISMLQEIRLAAPALLVDELHVQPALHRIGTSTGTLDVSCAVFGFRSRSARIAAR